MHELSVCMSLLDQVTAIAAERDARRITRIELTVGPLSGIEIDLLETAWPIAAAGTLADNAAFVVTATEIVVQCRACGANTTAQNNRLLCGSCGASQTHVISGEEMILQRVELETSTDSG
ncbi:MAG: hydrogenase maturation nickel metallochaperone HypA [Woeseiaceae bacterium]|nr:hydrogenase maturation nickel metallochaperone HypA [Woeseiaceae bacterium]